MSDEPKPFDDRALRKRLDVDFALKIAQLGIWEIDPVTNLIIWDDQCRELFGLAKDNQLSYEQAIRHIHPEDKDQVDQAVKWAMTPQSGGNYDVTFRTIGADDQKLRWVRFTGQAYFNDAGEVYRFSGVAQNVTHQVAAQQLQASQERFRSLIEEAPVATCLFVGRGLIIEVINQSMLAHWGKADDVMGKPLAQALPELRGQPFLQILDDVFTTGKTYETSSMPANLEIDGILGTYYFAFTYKPLHNRAGKVYAILAMSIDVTEQVLARQQLEKAEASLRGAVELAELSTWSMDIKTGMFSYSARFMEWLGFSENTKPMDEAYNPLPYEFREQVANAIALTIQPGSSGLYTNEHPIINQLTGQKRIIQAQAQVFYDADGKPALLSGTAQDITAQRQLQLALEQQVQERTEELELTNEELAAANEELAAANEELASANDELTESNQLLARSNENLQRFAYVASHDLQEPLRKIRSFGDLLQSQYATQLGDGVDYLQRMHAAASRMSVLIKDLLTFSRISTQQDSTGKVSLTNVVASVLTDLELIIQETGARIEVAPLPTVQGDESQLGQLFQNLVSNALKFRQTSESDGPINPLIRINARQVAAADLPLSVKPSRIVRAYYRIDVADNGIGFDEKYLDRIFQVFQRLHSRGEFAGTGVGLAICEKVATNHGGAITAASQLGRGSTFSVYLPI